MATNRLHKRSTFFDRVLTPIHRWIWRDPQRRVQKLFAFGETETDGGRDILRAAEITRDPLLRRLYLEHAIDEFRHGMMFRQRAGTALRELNSAADGTFRAGWLAPGGHGLDDLQVDGESDESMLAFLHLSEKAAASRFTVYHDVLQSDPSTRAVFAEILRDEVFHMNYTYMQLSRLSANTHPWKLWRARLGRLWKCYLRLATALAGAIAAVVLTVQYFILLPPFAWLARRAQRHEQIGWTTISLDGNDSLSRQY